MIQVRCLGRALALLLLTLILGCGSKTSLHGKITLDGRPIEQGIIAFEPADGQGTSCGAPIADGKYDVVGTAPVSPGAKIVRIRGYRSTGKKLPKFPESKELVDDLVQVIPAEFNEKSTLRRDVVAGKSNELNFDLTTK